MTVAVIGDAFIDINVPTQDIRTGGTYQRVIKVSSGGTANVAVWLSRLKKESKFVGAVGNDSFGEFFKRDLKKEHVSSFLAIDNAHSTGMCTSLVEGSGERTMITYRGANDYLSKEHLDAHLEEIFDCNVLYLTGYSFTSDATRDSVEYILKQSKEYECEVWFNPGAPNISNIIPMNEIKEYVDVLVLNIEEATELTGQYGAHAILNHLEHLSNVIIMTMGADGCILTNKGEVTYTPALNVPDVVDTTGAGDAFAAGFIAGYSDNLAMEECSRLGHETATKVITKMGAR